MLEDPWPVEITSSPVVFNLEVPSFWKRELLLLTQFKVNEHKKTELNHICNAEKSAQEVYALSNALSHPIPEAMEGEQLTSQLHRCGWRPRRNLDDLLKLT